jgi:hypothetical protein
VESVQRRANGAGNAIELGILRKHAETKSVQEMMTQVMTHLQRKRR